VNKILLLLIVFPIISSCLSFNYNHIVEKFVEYKDINFNNVKKINIITKNKILSDAIKYFFIESYKSRGLTEPKLALFDNVKDGLSNELNINVILFDYNIKSGFVNEVNQVKYWKTIDVKYHIILFKSGLSDISCDLTGDITFSIDKNFYYNSESNKNVTVNAISQRKLKTIDNYSLFYGVVDKVFRPFLQKRLIPISRELINFKIGFNGDLLKAHKFVSDNKMEEALILWEQIFSDTDNSYYSRSVAAYNIGMYKATIEKDFESAELYFKKYDELEEERVKDFIRF